MTRKASVLMAALLGAAAIASDAHACGFFDYREVRPVRPKPVPVAANDRIAAADQRLDEERLTEAAVEVVTAFPRIRTAAVGASPLETRAQRILALAVVRSGGVIRGVPGISGSSDADRSANLAWSVGVLRAIDAQRHDDPVARADLAEALARSKHEDEALAILADLSDRDLVGSAHAYATLAQMRASRGDAEAARAAVQRCELMTKSPAVVCKAPASIANDGRLAVRD
jgi:hypothetical protein